MLVVLENVCVFACMHLTNRMNESLYAFLIERCFLFGIFLKLFSIDILHFLSFYLFCVFVCACAYKCVCFSCWFICNKNQNELTKFRYIFFQNFSFFFFIFFLSSFYACHFLSCLSLSLSLCLIKKRFSLK